MGWVWLVDFAKFLLHRCSSLQSLFKTWILHSERSQAEGMRMLVGDAHVFTKNQQESLTVSVRDLAVPKVPANL